MGVVPIPPIPHFQNKSRFPIFSDGIQTYMYSVVKHLQSQLSQFQIFVVAVHNLAVYP